MSIARTNTFLLALTLRTLYTWHKYLCITLRSGQTPKCETPLQCWSPVPNSDVLCSEDFCHIGYNANPDKSVSLDSYKQSDPVLTSSLQLSLMYLPWNSAWWKTNGQRSWYLGDLPPRQPGQRGRSASASSLLQNKLLRTVLKMLPNRIDLLAIVHISSETAMPGYRKREGKGRKPFNVTCINYHARLGSEICKWCMFYLSNAIWIISLQCLED